MDYKRLTRHTEFATELIREECKICKYNHSEAICSQCLRAENNAVNRLAELEDKIESGELQFKNIERFTRKESTYYEKAIARLQELETKIENGTLLELQDLHIESTAYGFYNIVGYVHNMDGVLSDIVVDGAFGTRAYAEEKLKELKGEINGD